MRSFVGIDLGREPAPDETTVCTPPSGILLEDTTQPGRHQLEFNLFINGVIVPVRMLKRHRSSMAQGVTGRADCVIGCCAGAIIGAGSCRHEVTQSS